MSKAIVNLDAMLPRADIFESAFTAKADSQEIRITDLEPSVTYDMLRKPDFQRETANWTPEQVARLVQTFCESDVIPAVILWQHGTHFFVVDGAHRLSALIAWVRNDYGAGELSQKLFKHSIPEAQRVAHERTATLIEETVGNWDVFKTKNPGMNLKNIRIQWITGYTPNEAAEAFIRINQGGTVILPLEARILRAKRSALAIATRVITHGGTGHPYWQHFTNHGAREKTSKLGKEIYDLLFHPPLQTPIKSTEVPLAGLGYGVEVLKLSFDLIGLANALPVPDSSRNRAPDVELPDDHEGTLTVEYLQETKKLVSLMLSNHKASLGLHPALYCYTSRGAFQAPTFLNVAAWVMDLKAKKQLDTFRKGRRTFEQMLLAHPAIIKPAVHKLGSGARTRGKMIEVLNHALTLAAKGKSVPVAWKMLKKQFPHLASDEAEEAQEASSGKSGGRFSRSAKTAATFADLSHVTTCALCGGLKHPNGITSDHKVAKAKGGKSSADNSRWVHPICNSNRSKDEGTGS